MLNRSMRKCMYIINNKNSYITVSLKSNEIIH